MDDIRQRDLSKKPYEQYSDEEKRELARRFKEFSQLVREKGAERMGLQSRPAKKKRVRKWDPATMGRAQPKAG